MTLNENTFATIYPLWGWAVVNYPYNMTPFVALLILHVANREMFTVDSADGPD